MRYILFSASETGIYTEVSIAYLRHHPIFDNIKIVLEDGRPRFFDRENGTEIIDNFYRAHILQFVADQRNGSWQSGPYSHLTSTPVILYNLDRKPEDQNIHVDKLKWTQQLSFEEIITKHKGVR